MIALLRKELGAVLPWLMVGVALVGTSLLSVLWDPDLLVDDLGRRMADGDDQCRILWLFGFLVGQGSVAYEERDGHTEFLDGLPTRRSTVFLAKGVATVGAIVLLTAGSFGSDLALHAATAPDGATSSLAALSLEHGLMLLSGLGGLGAGLLASWLGPLAYGVLGLATFVGFCSGLIHPPLRAWTPVVGTIGSLAWDRGEVSARAAPVLLQWALGGLLGLGSFGLFLGPGRALVVRGSQIVGLVRYGTVGCLSLLVGSVGALFAVILVAEYGGPLWAGYAVLPTRSFRVLYVPEDEDHALVVRDRVDAISDRVAELVGDDLEPPLALDLELLGTPANHLGVFTGGKIRMARRVGLDVIAHELTHAHAWRLAGRAGYEQRSHLHFFEEGLADWVALRIDGGDPVPLASGAIWATHQARFDELVESAEHQERHDVVQSYLLGQVFVEALVQREGEGAPGCLLRELHAVPAGSEPPGLALWYGLAARCDLDLDRVQDRWLELLQGAAERLPPLPRLRTRLVGDRLEVWDDLALGYPLRCGFRSSADDDVAHWVYVTAADGGCDLPVRVLDGPTFDAQVGFELPDRASSEPAVVFLPWTRLRAP